MRKFLLIFFVVAFSAVLLSSFDVITRGRASHTNTSEVQFLPSAPADAFPYDIASPLRNGKNVVAKKRWVSVPGGQAIQFFRQPNGKYTVEYPEGTTLWKEFYTETSAGVSLMERRLVTKLPTDDEKNGHLGNGGWSFTSAYAMPATDWSLEDLFPWNIRTISLQQAVFRSMFFKPGDPLPIQGRAPALRVDFVDENSASSSYMFPGTTNCSYCHQGANAAFANQDHDRVMAFGIHPENLTPESLGRLIRAKKVKIDRFEPAVKPEGSDEQTSQVVAMLRNNCLSCHNDDSKAAARHTAFRLEPNRFYSKTELAKLLSSRSLRFGVNGKPLVTPGKPEESEIVLRMTGAAGRLRMPPADGGVPVIDEEFALLLENWILTL